MDPFEAAKAKKAADEQRGAVTLASANEATKALWAHLVLNKDQLFAHRVDFVLAQNRFAGCLEIYLDVSNRWYVITREGGTFEARGEKKKYEIPADEWESTHNTTSIVTRDLGQSPEEVLSAIAEAAVRRWVLVPETNGYLFPPESVVEEHYRAKPKRQSERQRVAGKFWRRAIGCIASLGVALLFKSIGGAVAAIGEGAMILAALLALASLGEALMWLSTSPDAPADTH